MGSHPLVSILIPTFNQNLKHLKECVDSALGQSYKNIEVIVSDNHSTNGTGELLKGYCDDRLKVVSPDTFVPMNDNFAFCAKQAQGEFLSFLSSDDILLPVAIEIMIPFFSKQPDIVFGCGNIFHARQLPKTPGTRKSLLRKDTINIRILFGQNARSFFFPWTMASTWMAGDIIRRDAYEATGGLGCCDLHIAGDVWLTNRLLELGGFVCVGTPTALFRSRAIGHKEVDPSRRLFDFLDQLLLYKYTGILGAKPNFLMRLRQQIVLIYRLGADPGPSREALLRAGEIFETCARQDLVKRLEMFEKSPAMYRLVSKLLGGFKVVRDTCRLYLRKMF